LFTNPHLRGRPGRKKKERPGGIDFSGPLNAFVNNLTAIKAEEWLAVGGLSTSAFVTTSLLGLGREAD
jgi:hypothetical protein